MSVRTSPEITTNVSSQLVHGVADRAGGAERRLLDGVHHAHAELGAVAEVVADDVRHERHRHHDLVDAVAASAGPTMCSIIGRLTMGSIGLGALEVRGRSRVPSPPAMMTAFTDSLSLATPRRGRSDPEPTARRADRSRRNDVPARFPGRAPGSGRRRGVAPGPSLPQGRGAPWGSSRRTRSCEQTRPGIAAPQAMTSSKVRAVSDRPVSVEARNAGNATIIPKVPALPLPRDVHALGAPGP